LECNIGIRVAAALTAPLTRVVGRVDEPRETIETPEAWLRVHKKHPDIAGYPLDVVRPGDALNAWRHQHHSDWLKQPFDSLAQRFRARQLRSHVASLADARAGRRDGDDQRATRADEFFLANFPLRLVPHAGSTSPRIASRWT
jgi:hypothetical protein